MSIRQNFGSLRGDLQNTYTVGVRDNDLNSNLIIQLPSKVDVRIFTISASYVRNAKPDELSLFGGRLLVVNTKFDDDSAEIIPNAKDLPDTLSASDIVFDSFVGAEISQPLVGGSDTTGGNHIHRHFNFENGLYIPAGSGVSIILTYCLEINSNARWYETSGSNLAILAAHGLTGGSDKVYKNA